MKEFVCPKCKSKDIFIERNGDRDGLYCGSCGNLIKWLNKKELRLAERQVEKMNGISEDMEE